jgi:hypothetical protein
MRKKRRDSGSDSETYYTENKQPSFKDRLKGYWDPQQDSDGARVKEQIQKMQNNRSDKSLLGDEELPTVLPTGALGAQDLP